MDVPIESIFVDGRYKGAVLPRGPRGFEAYDHMERSLGIYDDRARARAAVQGKAPECLDC